MKAALRDSISVHALIPKVSNAAHIFFSKALGNFSLLAILLGRSTGMISDDADCKTTSEITALIWNRPDVCVGKGGE